MLMVLLFGSLGYTCKFSKGPREREGKVFRYIDNYIERGRER